MRRNVDKTMRIMKILHVCNDFLGSKVHRSLYVKLADEQVSQTVYTYFRKYQYAEKLNEIQQNMPQILIVGAAILKRYHRIFYHRKLSVVLKDLLGRLDGGSFDCVHAATLFSDGGIAYQLYRQFHIPYIVSVRNTDVNTFLGYAPWTWGTGCKVLLYASKIVFISQALLEKFRRHPLIKMIYGKIADKIIVQPNGIDDYWIDHLQTVGRNNQRLLYVGNFSANKNALRLMRAVLRVRHQCPGIHLDLVGDGGQQTSRMLQLVSRYPSVFQYRGAIYDKEELLALYRSCSVFAMPSLHETFGLVYVEALSQGCRVLYTRGQGIDGMFAEQVGQGVNARSVSCICQVIQKLLVATTSTNSIDFEAFRWSRIAKRYRELYTHVVK